MFFSITDISTELTLSEMNSSYRRNRKRKIIKAIEIIWEREYGKWELDEGFIVIRYFRKRPAQVEVTSHGMVFLWASTTRLYHWLKLWCYTWNGTDWITKTNDNQS